MRRVPRGNDGGPATVAMTVPINRRINRRIDGRIDTEVLVVGAEPPSPKCNHVSARSMEIFRG